MNDLQQIEFDLFRVFAATCEKLNLNYFLVCGSALGAMRHGGFIPWDDDMDVGMYREDYNLFMEQAPALLPEGIFLQNYNSDPAYPNVFAKLRNSNTTYIEKSVKNLPINHGIYLDIFPLDGLPTRRLEQRKLSFLKSLYVNALLSGNAAPPTFKGKLLLLPFRILGCPKRTASIVRRYSALISKYPVRSSTMICNHGTWYGERDYIPKKLYGNGADATFEGIRVRVPEDCDGYLTWLFGDWRTPPPKEKQKGHHYYELCDTKKPYTYYLNKKV